MKKLILSLSVLSFFALTIQIVLAAEPEKSITVQPVAVRCDTNTAQMIYHLIQFPEKDSLSFEAFEKAYKGYQKLRAENKLSDQEIITVCDFTKPSSTQRLWIIDLSSKHVLLHDYVAHGQGSGGDLATSFSNREHSHQSSIGFYVTGDTYVGQHGNSLRLRGMDEGYNSAAYQRAIVVHGADYVSPEFIAAQKRLGRSWGCPAVSGKISDKVIELIKDGTCFFIYYPEQKYLETSVWLQG